MHLAAMLKSGRRAQGGGAANDCQVGTCCAMLPAGPKRRYGNIRISGRGFRAGQHRSDEKIAFPSSFGLDLRRSSACGDGLPAKARPGAAGTK